MRRVALAFLVVLVVATPAFGDDATKKQQIDSQISSLQGKLAAQKRKESRLRNEVADFTSRIRTLESKVGDVSLRLSTMEADLRSFEGDKTAKARTVGELVAERAKTAGVDGVVFDRAGNKYHGRVAALAEGAREGGLTF